MLRRTQRRTTCRNLTLVKSLSFSPVTKKPLLGWENGFFSLEASDQGASSHEKKSMKAQPGQKLRAFEIQKNEYVALS